MMLYTRFSDFKVGDFSTPLLQFTEKVESVNMTRDGFKLNDRIIVYESVKKLGSTMFL